MYGKYYVVSYIYSDNGAYRYYEFEGEYLESDIVGNTKGNVPILGYNHANTDCEIDAMTRFIKITRDMLGLARTGKGDGDIDEAEKRLGIEIPKAVKEFYNALDGDYKFTLDSKTWKILPPDKLYVDDNVLVFSCHGKKHAEYRGIDLSNRHTMYKFGNTEWSDRDGYYSENKSFCELMTEGAAMTAIMRMPVNRYYRLNKKDNVIKVERETQFLWKRCDEHYDTGSTIMINEETKSIAWVRQFLFSPDIYIGTQSEDVIRKFREIKGMDKD